MNKGHTTKEYIIEKAASIFNKNGFAGASLSELMNATGLKKGGIYNHFKNKDDIILEAFEFAIKKMRRSVYEAYKDELSPLNQLKAIIRYYKDYPLNPVIEGGCPIVNTAIDSDNTHPALKARVKEVVSSLITIVKEIIQQGIDEGEVKSCINTHDTAVLIVTTLHGGIIISRSLDSNDSMHVVVNKLIDYIKYNLQK
jgi:TetR/AcrR family transcriptional repressor of nem operon